MESSLNDRYKDICGDVGVFLGWGSDPEGWADDQKATITRFVKSGLRTFYFPPPIGGVVYEWSFLKPVATLTLTSGDDMLELPEDFGGMSSSITVANDGSSVAVPWPILLTVEGRLREMYAPNDTITGRPIAAALVPIRGVTHERSSREQLRFFPLPDAAYTVQFAYNLLPEMLDGTKPYAYGGAIHAETILEACLAQAELKGDDVGDGPHSMKFAERLAASIAMDRKKKAHVLGYNGDRSDGMEGRSRYGLHGFNVAGITYNGSEI